MTTWFTSDLHIGHAKVAEYRANEAVVCRPFPDPDHAHVINWHDRTLARHWDWLVKPEDTIWVLGDISAGGRAAQLNALEWIKQRPGTKHLIAGNHDGCHPMHRDSHKWQRVYLEAFESVQMAAKRRFRKDQGHTTALLSHFPYEGDRELTRFPEWRLKDAGYPILHGHTHSTEKLSYSVEITLQIHVGVDAWGMRPVSLEEVGELLW